nr:MAG TPA: hypothetical protein [Caudoviricetes sp.]
MISHSLTHQKWSTYALKVIRLQLRRDNLILYTI